jgi:hypothetical protein
MSAVGSAEVSLLTIIVA